jgi:hypothetical protein
LVDRFMPGFCPTLDLKQAQVRPLEVLTGVGGPAAMVVGRCATPRHPPQQLFGGRCGIRIGDPEPRMTFVPALVEAPEKVERPRPRRVGAGRGDIELEIDGLAALVKDEVLKDPYSGVVYVFPRQARRPGEDDLLGRNGSVADSQAFNWPKVQDGVMRLTPA